MRRIILMGLLCMAGAQGLATADALHFSIDTAASEITAAVPEPMSAIRGTAVGNLKVSSGEISGDSANAAATGKVKLVIDAASYHTDSDSRDRDVKSSVLETDAYPTITFESTALSGVAITSDHTGSATVAGNLTLHGVTRSISVPITGALDGAGRFTADGETTFKYGDFGIKTPSLLGLLKAGDEVTVKFHVVATRQ